MELNEWDYAAAIFKQLETNSEAKFSILPESTNSLYDLVIEDSEGVVYQVQDEEAKQLHLHLLQDRNLIYIVDQVTSQIVYKPFRPVT